MSACRFPVFLRDSADPVTLEAYNSAEELAAALDDMPEGLKESEAWDDLGRRVQLAAFQRMIGKKPFPPVEVYQEPALDEILRAIAQYASAARCATPHIHGESPKEYLDRVHETMRQRRRNSGRDNKSGSDKGT